MARTTAGQRLRPRLRLLEPAKFIGPAGLAVIAGASNYVAPKATLAALVPGFNYFAGWFLLAVVSFLLIGIETRGRTIEELDAALVCAGR